MRRTLLDGTYFDDSAEGVRSWAAKDRADGSIRLWCTRTKDWVVECEIKKDEGPSHLSVDAEQAGAWLLAQGHELPLDLEQEIAGNGAGAARPGPKRQAPDGGARGVVSLRLSKTEKARIEHEGAKKGRDFSDEARFRLLEAPELLQTADRLIAEATDIDHLRTEWAAARAAGRTET